MKILKTKEFTRSFRRLPKSVQKLYVKQEDIFQKNWLDSRLHLKRLKELPGIYSFRVTRRYRVLIYFKDGATAVFFAVGHRKDIYE